MSAINFGELIDGLANDIGQLFGSPGKGGDDPFQGSTGKGGDDPFGGSIQNASNPWVDDSGQTPFSQSSPFEGVWTPSTPMFAQFAAERANQEAAAKARTATATSTLYPGGATGVAGDEKWARIDQYSGLIDQAAGSAGIDGDVFRAIMYNESGGDPNAREPTLGASGLLQLMPSVWNGRGDPLDPATNLKLGAELMRAKVAGVKQAYAKNGITADDRTFARDLALAWGGHFNYKTGLPDPNSQDAVFKQTAAQLSAIFLKNYDTIKAARAAKVTAGGGGRVTAGGPMGGLFGGNTYGITQEFGHTDFSGGEGASIYDFGAEFGLDGDEHSGLDIGAPDGTKTYSPVGGTVTIAGGSGYYKDETGRHDPATSGEVRINMDDGSILILGHMGQINLKAGQRINPGDFVGLTGTANGPHLHVELRIPDKTTRSGWRIVDPRTKIKF